MFLKPGQTLLFQGDSITDCNRDRTLSDSLGSGYVNMIAGLLAARQPHLGAACLNRGISGNRSEDLLKRWREDCLDLKPDVLSLFIGINDVWRRYDSNLPTSTEAFAANYRRILEATVKALPESLLILLEPFVLPVPEDRRHWREDLDPKIDVVRHLAREFGARLVPLDGIFAAASTAQPPAFWARDGVHPTPAGHGLIARAWLEAVGVFRSSPDA
ncbi:MAG TPA: SGNH/GDSL hydrolase family protein, partial [Oceanipulchritudo sp.]|nr:SGNH/GDSL hydrolase family protein [Oceanipulchritudo sp.]